MTYPKRHLDIGNWKIICGKEPRNRLTLNTTERLSRVTCKDCLTLYVAGLNPLEIVQTRNRIRLNLLAVKFGGTEPSLLDICTRCHETFIAHYFSEFCADEIHDLKHE